MEAGGEFFSFWGEADVDFFFSWSALRENFLKIYVQGGEFFFLKTSCSPPPGNLMVRPLTIVQTSDDFQKNE